MYHYNILVNGKFVETNLLGWTTALAHAREHDCDLFAKGKKIIEILNVETAQIVTLQEAEKFAKRH